MELTIKRYITRPLATNSYVLIPPHGGGIIIDPSLGCSAMLSFLTQQGISIEALLLTHAHFDHFLGIPEIQSIFQNCAIWIHRDDEPLLRDSKKNGSLLFGIPYEYTGPVNYLQEGTRYISCIPITVLHLPGHSPGGCAFVYKNYCFSGDSLLAGRLGPTDLPYSNKSQLVENICKKLLTLSNTTVVMAGHGGRTTIGREKRLNPFFKS